MTMAPDALQWHLTANFYPPMPQMEKAAERAVTACATFHEHKRVRVPSGKYLPAVLIVEDLRLWDFVEAEQDPSSLGGVVHSVRGMLYPARRFYREVGNPHLDE